MCCCVRSRGPWPQRKRNTSLSRSFVIVIVTESRFATRTPTALTTTLGNAPGVVGSIAELHAVATMTRLERLRVRRIGSRKNSLRKTEKGDSPSLDQSLLLHFCAKISRSSAKRAGKDPWLFERETLRHDSQKSPEETASPVA